MFRIKIHKTINGILEFFYRIGLWNRQEGKTFVKIFISFYYALFPISTLAGAISTYNSQMEAKIQLVESAMIAIPLLVKLLYAIWRKREILELMNRICDYHVDDGKAFSTVNNKLNIFMTLASVLLWSTSLASASIAFVVPFLGKERSLFFGIGFPLDWRNNEFAYWMAFTFVSTQMAFSAALVSFSVVIWYLMANCSWRYEIFGQQVMRMGERRNLESVKEHRMSNTERDKLYFRDLVEAIRSSTPLIEMTNQMDSFLSTIFGFQLTTSGLGICTSIYIMSFARGSSFIVLLTHFVVLMYNIFDIFMIMFYGNAIMAASDRLSYCLYASDWIGRSQSIKKSVLIFGELLMQPHQLIVLKSFPLTLKTFMRVLNSSYSMFNLLESFK